MNNLNFPPRLSYVRMSLAATLIGSVAMGVGLTGCGSEPEEQVATTPTYTPPPPEPQRPRVTPIAELMAEMRIDERIYFPEERAPDNDPARRALLEFFDGFARGEASVVRNMLEGFDQRELEAMVDSGQWDKATDQIENIEIWQTGQASASQAMDDISASMQELQRMSSGELRRMFESGELRDAAGMSDEEYKRLQGLMGTPEFEQHLQELVLSMASMPAASSTAMYAGEECVVAIIRVNGYEQAQMWYYQPRNDRFVFQSAPTPPDMVDKLGGTDWIKAWHDIIDREMMLASRPDEDFAPPQRSLDDGGGSDGPSQSSPSGPAGPRGPGLPPPPPQEVPKGPGVGGN